jgi:hypothetical protein
VGVAFLEMDGINMDITGVGSGSSDLFQASTATED